MIIKKIGLAWIQTNDFKKSEEFFAKKLGLTVLEKVDEYGWMECGTNEKNFRIGIAQYNPDQADQPAGSNAVITFTVDDIIAAKAELEAQNVTFIDEIIEVPGDVKMVTFIDNDGNRFQLVQEAQ